MSKQSALELMRREVTPQLYEQIRSEWKAHSIAEDERDIAGLLSTLTPDCVYQIVSTDYVWRGHEGARRFYTELLGAFPDIRFDLTDIVIGPQGVYEAADVTATHRARWLDYAPSGKRLALKVSIFFPWDPERGKFAGEKVVTDLGPLASPAS